MNDLAVAWRDEQIEMLRAEIVGLQAWVKDLQALLALADERASRAETTLYNLKEEIRDARPDD